MNLNFSASVNVFKLLVKPSLCLPHVTVSTFNDLPIPLDSAFEKAGGRADIKAVVLDKDDCFAYPKKNEVYHVYEARNPRIHDIRPRANLLSRRNLKPSRQPTQAGAC